MSKSYQYDLQVKKEHLDALDHVNNVQYLQWVQEIAGAHWESLIKDKESDYGIWVVRSHTINYKRSCPLPLQVEQVPYSTPGALSQEKY